MVSNDHKLSVRRQCKLLTLTRSHLYYEPKGESWQTSRSTTQMEKMSQTEMTTYFKKGFTPLRSGDEILEMQNYIRHYPTLIVPRINKLLAMYELWSDEKFFVIQPLALKEWERANRYIERLIEPKFDSVFHSFSNQRAINDAHRNRMVSMRSAIYHQINKYSIYLHNFPDRRNRIEKVDQDNSSQRTDYFREPFMDRRWFYRFSLLNEFESHLAEFDFSLNPELISLIDTYNKEEKQFSLLSFFKPVVSDLKRYGVTINKSGYREQGLTWEKDYYLGMHSEKSYSNFRQ